MEVPMDRVKTEVKVEFSEPETEPLRASQTSSSTLGKWLVIFSQVYRQEITEPAVWAFREALADLSDSEVELACREVIKRVKFFPTPADVRECLATARSNIQPVKRLLLPEPEQTEEERAACAEARTNFRNELKRIAEKAEMEHKQRATVVSCPASSIGQPASVRNWCLAQDENDGTPRSGFEREAIILTKKGHAAAVRETAKGAA